MDVNVLPQKYQRNNGSMISCLIRGTKAEKSEKITALKNEKKPFWKKDFEDYIKTICIKQWVKVAIWSGIVLGIIGAIVLALVVPFDDMEWYLAAAAFFIPMALCIMSVMFLGPRAVFGAVLAVVLSPIFYPIYASIYNAHNKKVNRYNQEIDAKLNMLRNEYDEQINNFRSGFVLMIVEYEKAFRLEKKAQIEKFADNPAVLEIAEWLSKIFIKNISNSNRASHIKEVIVPLYVYVTKTDIKCGSETYSFEYHRCKDLENELMQAALAEAVAFQIQAYVKSHYKKDESGTKYKIQIDFSNNLEAPAEKFEKEKAYPDTTELLLCITLTYRAENANYKSAQSW